MFQRKDSNNKNSEEQENTSFWSILGIASIICVVICFLGILASYWYVGCSSDATSSIAERRGLFGDSWGGVNALISALAFAGVIATLYLQNADLKLQRKEMKEQRKEFEKENETLKYQRFENLFYNMLNLHQEIVAGLRYEYTEDEYVLVPSGNDSPPVQDKRKVNRVVTGREVFRYTFERAGIYLNERDHFNQRKEVNGYREFLNAKGLVSYDETWIPTIFDHYFRHLYKIIQFVDEQGFSFEESYKYISLLRGTLSRYELVWIYYNALDPAFYKFKELIEKYCLLKNIREDLLTRTMEMEEYMIKLRVNAEDIRNKGFTARDFEFYLTDDKEETARYHLSAFWKKDEIASGKERLDRWRSFIKKVEEKTGEEA